MSLKSLTDKIVNLDEIILEEAKARKTAKQLGMRLNILGTSYYILEDGKITTEDGKVLAQGVLQHLIIANEARLMTQLSVRGALAFGSSLVGGLAIVYGAGVTISYLIDPEDGVKNFHDFLKITANNPTVGATVAVISGQIVGEHLIESVPDVLDSTEIAIGTAIATNPILSSIEKYSIRLLEGLFLGTGPRYD